jgi:serine/threonine-protein kinase HipA
MIMLKKGLVYYNNIEAGEIIHTGSEYIFRYFKDYLINDALPPLSVTLPKSEDEIRSETLFPFFYGLLAEGELKNFQCQKLKIDEKDHFTRLIKTAGQNTIGAVTVKEDQNE